MEIGVRGSAITVIEPGIDVPTGPVPSKSEEPLFLSLNRLVPHKRIDLLLEAWKVAAVTIPGRLIVVGDGPELADLRRQAASIPRVEVRGRVNEDEKQELLARAWAVVSAAHHEGWGMSVMEAAAVGTPAVAVEARGIRDAIIDGATGVLVRANEAEIPEAFARVMIDLVNDDERRGALGRCARRRALDFGWDLFLERWEAVLGCASDAPELSPDASGLAASSATPGVTPCE